MNQPTQAQAPSEREAFALDPLEKAIDAYVADYETGYDSGTYTPDDEERFRIKDAIMGLLADPEWDRLWGEHIAALATQQAGQGEVVAWRFRLATDMGWSNWRTDKEDHDRFKREGYRIEYAYTPPAPQQPEAMSDPQIAAAFNDWARGHEGSAHVESFRAGARFAERRGTTKQPEAQSDEAAAIEFYRLNPSAALLDFRKRVTQHPEALAQQERDREDAPCPDGLLPDGEICPRCGGKRGPSGIDGGSWVHIRAARSSEGGSNV